MKFIRAFFITLLLSFFTTTFTLKPRLLSPKSPLCTRDHQSHQHIDFTYFGQVIGINNPQSEGKDFLASTYIVKIIVFNYQYIANLIKCGDFTINGATKFDYSRSNSFNDVLVCWYSEPGGKSSIHYKNYTFPIPNIYKNEGEVYDNIAFIGDTGCRNNTNHPCTPGTTDNLWGFNSVLNCMKDDYDLVVHVGDYRYIESNRDKSIYWLKEFFCPISENGFLQKQPFIFMRGNHEGCESKHDMGGEGYFSFFQYEESVYGPYKQIHCYLQDGDTNYEQKYGINPWYFYLRNDHMGIVLDSNYANDSMDAVHPQKHLKQLEKVLGEEVLTIYKNCTQCEKTIFSHRPIWGFKNQKKFINSTLQQILLQEKYQDVLKNAKVILSGHLHRAQEISFNDEQNPEIQIIVGNSGVNLNPGSVVSPYQFPWFNGETREGNIDINHDYFGFETWSWDENTKSYDKKFTYAAQNGDCISGYRRKKVIIN